MQLLAHGCVGCRCGWSLVLLGLVAGDRVALQECWETRRFPALAVQELGGCVDCLQAVVLPLGLGARFPKLP